MGDGHGAHHHMAKALQAAVLFACFIPGEVHPVLGTGRHISDLVLGELLSDAVFCHSSRNEDRVALNKKLHVSQLCC